jgi:hypothetical protein
VSTAVVVGAGDIGGALARQLAAIDAVSRIVMVDDLASVAAGKALDVAQSAPVDRYHTLVAGTADVAAVVGAVAVIIADAAANPGTEWRDEGGLALVKRIAGLNQLAPIICAGASQAGLIERGVHELGVSRMRLFGSAPEALRSAITAIVSLEAGAAPQDISLSVLGRAPQQIIVPWDEAAIAGRTATEVLSAAQLARLDARIARLWPPGPYALGGAAAPTGAHGVDPDASRARGTRRGWPGRRLTGPIGDDAGDPATRRDRIHRHTGALGARSGPIRICNPQLIVLRSCYRRSTFALRT